MTGAPRALPEFSPLRRRVRPSSGALARRRRHIRLAKLILPGLALILLTLLAVWPQLARQDGAAQRAFRALIPGVHGDTVFGARYHGRDQDNRPYVLAARVARRVAPGRVDLTHPRGEIRLASGALLMLRSRRGVYRNHLHELDLSRQVTLYRTDGTTLITASAAIDLQRGLAVGAAPVHATGPFGTLSSQGGFSLLDRGAEITFVGPARLVLNGASK
jgi:lipopolysaccharide export system protein LptC